MKHSLAHFIFRVVDIFIVIAFLAFTFGIPYAIIHFVSKFW